MAKITTNTPNGNITITPNGTGEVDISKVDIDGGTIDGTVIGGTTPAAGTFTTFTSTGIDDNASSGPALTIDASGNVGIGTSSPSTILHAVATGGAIRVQDNISTSKHLQIRSDSSNSHLEHTGGPSDALRINNKASGTIEFFTAGTERMTIDASGNIQLANSLTAGTIGSGVTFPAGHILQCLDATVTNVDNTLTTTNKYVAEVDSQITIKSGNYVKLTVYLNLLINGGVSTALGSVRIHQGTVSSPSTQLFTTGTIGDNQNTSAIYLPVTLSIIDQSPASTTPSYCFRINNDSGGTLSVEISGTPIVILEEINV